MRSIVAAQSPSMYKTFHIRQFAGPFHPFFSGEVIGAKLAAKYSAKELAGRVQQLQLLIREKEMKMEPEMQQKLWNQLEAEINLHRHKTIIRECRYEII